MKQQQINKLYIKLTPHEQAALAFEAAMRRDEEEVSIILNSVEKCTYITPNKEYQHRSYGLVHLSGVYGIFYWKTLCQLSALTGLSADSTKDVTYTRATQRYADEIVSMDIALEGLCKELKIAPDVIKTFAECEGSQPKLDGQPNDKLIALYTELFSKSVQLN